MLENLFINYANYPLRNNLENIRIIFEDIFSCAEPGRSAGKIFSKWLIDGIVELSRLNDPKIAKEALKTIKKEREIFTNVYDVAYEAIYMYRNKFCEKECFETYGIDYDEVLKKNGLSSDVRLKCYECYQLNYINHLSELVLMGNLKDMIEFFIMDKDTYHTIPKKTLDELNIKIGDRNRVSASGSFENLYLRDAYGCMRVEGEITDDGELKKSHFLDLTNLVHEANSAYPLKTRFIDVLNSLVGFSLTEFLLNNDPKKIKRCGECMKFYVSKTIRPSRFCSDKCRLAWHNRKYIESGKAKEYKKKGRKEGKYQ